MKVVVFKSPKLLAGILRLIFKIKKKKHKKKILKLKQSAGFAGGLFQFVKKLFYLRLNVSHSVSFLQHAPAPCTVIESA